MERFNPFSHDLDPDPFTTSFNRSSDSPSTRAKQPAACQEVRSAESPMEPEEPEETSALLSGSQAGRYSTSFPDPFAGSPVSRPDELLASSKAGTVVRATNSEHRAPPSSSAATMGGHRSNSVTFAPLSSQSVDESLNLPDSRLRSARGPRAEPGGGFSSFLSRATSVTSSSVTDRVSGAVGSVRSAVDSISSQIQQAVPSNLNERLTSTATNLIGGGAELQQQQSAASYLASKLSSATGQFTSAGQSPSSMPVINRQRVVLILDTLADTDWALQFTNYHRLKAGLTALQASQSAFSSFISQATAQLSSSSSHLSANLNPDLIEQVDFRNVSVLANQSSSTACVFVAPSQAHCLSLQQQQQQLFQQPQPQQQLQLQLQLQQQQPHQQQQAQQLSQSLMRTNSLASKSQQVQGYRIIRPEYVVVRQRSRERQEDLRSIVSALNYCLVPMFEPIEVWDCFQDRQLLFSKLLRAQKQLGRENFPLIPQVLCQTNQDLLNYTSGPSVQLPCLIRIGARGQGKIRIDSQQMLADFSTIMASSGLSCTIEPYLEAKYDLVIQRLGDSCKLFRRTIKTRTLQASSSSTATGAPSSASSNQEPEGRRGLLSESSFGSPVETGAVHQKQSAFRQTSLGSSVLSSLISSGNSASLVQQQLQTNRRSSNATGPQGYERMSEVNVRYKTWLDTIARQFDNKLKAFSVKVVVASNDREYIVGMRDCSMDFLGTLDNQNEDKRSFVELIIGDMNTNLPEHSGINRETSLSLAQQATSITTREPPPVDPLKRGTSDDDHDHKAAGQVRLSKIPGHHEPQSAGLIANLADKKRFTSQTLIEGPEAARSSGGLGNRSQSVSVNKSDYLNGEQSVNKPYFTRRSSDRSDGSLTDSELVSSDNNNTSLTSNSSGFHQRQSSLGQSFFDHTSTALSSFQKQSMSFFKRFDVQPAGSNSPPQSAKSDRSFLLSSASQVEPAQLAPAARGTSLAGPGSLARGNGFKSQSMDTTASLDGDFGRLSSRKLPPKPPPPAPHSLMNRQNSLASSYAGHRGANAALASSTATPNCTPCQSRQNSTVLAESQQQQQQQQRNRVVRQNSALSAFEPFDTAPICKAEVAAQHSPADLRAQPDNKELAGAARKGPNLDAASTTSGDSTGSTVETVTGEDTMNNLKKTFASIFGDRCD